MIWSLCMSPVYQLYHKNGVIMKILLAPDSFKGSMSSIEVIDCIEEVAKVHFDPIEIIKVPIADGGEGTIEALVTVKNGEYKQVEVKGPLGETVKAKYGVITERDGISTAVIEMAQASGLPLIEPAKRNPLLTTTYGTGEIIKAALDEGIRDFIIGIGGSATNDGGIGAAQALGIQFLNSEGIDVGLGGKELLKIRDINMDSIDHRIKESKITVICDVINPLTGVYGATSIFGPQKGATEEMLHILEEGMKNYAKVILETLGIDMNKVPGSGAAGGLGAALTGFFKGELKPGIDTILEFIEFDKLLQGVDFVITGEGKIDGQSVYGKVPVGIAKLCKKHRVKVVAITGAMGDGAQDLYRYGIESIMTTINKDMDLHEAMLRAKELLKNSADRMFRFIKLGMDL